MGYITFLSLCTLMTAGCSQDTVEGNEPSTGNKEIRLLLSVQNEVESRSVLENSEEIQQVDAAQLYIFDGTTEQAKCVDSKDIGWTQPTGGAASQTYTIQADWGSEEYLLLAVGTDQDARTVYGLPDGIAKGTTLGEAKAKLASGQNYTAIAKAPVFAGSVTAKAGETKQITLNRRVAGILLNIKNIPISFKLADDSSSEPVEYIQLVLSKNQNSSIPLQAAQNVFGSDPVENSNVLSSFDLRNDYGAMPGDGNYYVFEYFKEGAETTTITHSLFQGMFMLPTDRLEGTSTLSIQALDGSKKLLYTWELTNNANRKDYPIEANCLYQIGSKTATEDQPLDLVRNEIILVPEYEVIFDIKAP